MDEPIINTIKINIGKLKFLNNLYLFMGVNVKLLTFFNKGPIFIHLFIIKVLVSFIFDNQIFIFEEFSITSF